MKQLLFNIKRLNLYGCSLNLHNSSKKNKTMCIPSQSWNYTICIFSIGVAFAYHTRIRDGITFVRASEPSIMLTIYYNFHLSPPKNVRHPSKSWIEHWTNNKAFKSRFRPDSNCERFGRTETMEHVLHEHKHFSELLWNKLWEVWRSSSTIGPPTWCQGWSWDKLTWFTKFHIPYSVTSNTRSEEGCHIQTDEPAPLCATNNGSSAASCTPQFHSPKATFLPTIHWNCQKCQSHRNSVSTSRN
jgi:hypothetical protein